MKGMITTIRPSKENQVGIFLCTKKWCEQVVQFNQTFLIDDPSHLEKVIYYSLVNRFFDIPEEILQQYKAFTITMTSTGYIMICTSTLKRSEQVAEWIDSVKMSNKLSK